MSIYKSIIDSSKVNIDYLIGYEKDHYFIRYKIFNLIDSNFCIQVTSENDVVMNSNGKKFDFYKDGNENFIISKIKNDTKIYCDQNNQLDLLLEEKDFYNFIKVYEEYQVCNYKYFDYRVNYKYPNDFPQYSDQFVEFTNNFREQLYNMITPDNRMICMNDVYYYNGSYISSKDKIIARPLNISYEECQKDTLDNRYVVKSLDMFCDEEDTFYEPVYYFRYHVNNYLHFIRDTLPYLGNYLHIKKKYTDTKLLIPITSKDYVLHPFFFDILKQLNIEESDLLIWDISKVKQTLFKKFIFTDMSVMYKQFGEYLLDKHGLFNSVYNCITNKGKKFNQMYQKLDYSNIYLSRRTWTKNEDHCKKVGQDNTMIRKLENEDELVYLLKKYGFIEIFAEDYEICEKIGLFNNTKNIFTTYSAGLATGIFTNDCHYTIFNSLSISIDKGFVGLLAKNNKVTSKNFFLNDREKEKNCPWKIDLDKVESYLQEKGFTKSEMERNIFYYKDYNSDVLKMNFEDEINLDNRYIKFKDSEGKYKNFCVNIKECLLYQKNLISLDDSYCVKKDEFNQDQINEIFKNEASNTKKRNDTPIFSLNGSLINYLFFIRDVMPNLEYYLVLKEHIPNLKLSLNFNDEYKCEFVKNTLDVLGIDKTDLVKILPNVYYKNIFVAINTKFHRYLWDYPFFNNIFDRIDKKLLNYKPEKRIIMNKDLLEKIKANSDNTIDKTLNDDDKKEFKLYVNTYDYVYISTRYWLRMLDINREEINSINKKLDNEDKLVELLKKYGFKELFIEDYNLYDRVNILNKSKMIIQTNGDNIINNVFLNNKNIHVLNVPGLRINDAIRAKIMTKNNIKTYEFYDEGNETVENRNNWDINLDDVEKMLKENMK